MTTIGCQRRPCRVRDSSQCSFDAALAHRDPIDPQAISLAGEIDLVGPRRCLRIVSVLHPGDELSRLVCANYDDLTRRKVTL